MKKLAAGSGATRRRSPKTSVMAWAPMSSKLKLCARTPTLLEIAFRHVHHSCRNVTQRCLQKIYADALAFRPVGLAGLLQRRRVSPIYPASSSLLSPCLLIGHVEQSEMSLITERLCEGVSDALQSVKGDWQGQQSGARSKVGSLGWDRLGKRMSSLNILSCSLQ